MRVLLLHNYYQQWGGEDASTEQDLRLLQRYGHQVHFYQRHNDIIKDFSPLRKGALFFEPTWSLRSYREIRKVIQQFRPDVAHFQNFFPLISPSGHYACKALGVPVVQSLRNYRLLCPLGVFFRDGTICEECLRRSLWSGISYGCYHDSRLQTLSTALMLASHRLLKTWKRVEAYIALTPFSRDKFVEGGLPASKIFVRPNFLQQDPGVGVSTREGAVFVGRLSPEKGLATLLKAWRKLGNVPLKIVGTGSMRPWIEGYIRQHNMGQVVLTGFLNVRGVLEQVKQARFLVMPSIWYETFGRTIIEAYATGTPVIASDLGAMADLVEDHETGLLFTPGNPVDLVKRVHYTLEHPSEVMRWGLAARKRFEQEYSATEAYERLMLIYNKLVEK